MRRGGGRTRDAITLPWPGPCFKDAGTRLVKDVAPFVQITSASRCPRERETEAREILEMLLPPVTEEDGDTSGEMPEPAPFRQRFEKACPILAVDYALHSREMTTQFPAFGKVVLPKRNVCRRSLQV